MKRQVLFICVMALSTTLVACGNKKTDDEKELDEIRSELYDDGDEDDYSEDKIASIKLVEASDEIKNSILTDEIVQVSNSVLPTDGTMTVGEIVGKLEAENDFTILFEDDMNQNSLVETIRYTLPGISLINSSNNEEICRITYINTNSAPINFYECKVVSIDDPGQYSIESLNFFYPGNICYGTYICSDDIIATKEYETRIKDYPVLEYSEIIPFLSKNGIDIKEEEMGEEINFDFACENPAYCEDDVDMYKEINCTLHVDMATAKCKNIRFWNAYWGGNMLYKKVKDTSELPSDFLETCKEEAIQKYMNSIYYDGSESAEVVGAFALNSRDDFAFIIKTSNGAYKREDYSVNLLYNHSYETRAGLVGYEESDSFEGLLEECFVDDDDLVIRY